MTSTTKSTPIGDRLNELLEAMPPYRAGDPPGWNLYQLAADTGLTHNGLYLIVRGDRAAPDADTIYKICHALSRGSDKKRDALIAEMVRLVSEEKEARS